jgi:RNA polymerase sigma factor (sigma-70 family)
MVVAELAAFPTRKADRSLSAPEGWASERLLLQAVKDGDTAAAEELVDRTYAAVFASACRLCGDRELAADLTQETYRKAWAALGSFDGRSQLFTWLYRIAYTTFLNQLRRPRRMTSLEETPHLEVADAAPRADELLSNAEEAEQLRSAVLRLSDDLRFTVTAHFWGGLAVREIAAVEGITTVAVRKRLHRAFTLLEAMLDEEIR